jgi:tetratricopeptide (TPR) repeat protein
MKTRMIFLYMTACIVAILSTQVSCSSTSADNKVEGGKQELNIPYLKNRPDGLGPSDERVQISVKYDEAVAKIRANGNDAKAWLALAEIFINEARVTGEHPYYYPAALEVISRAMDIKTIIDDDRFQALSLKGMVEMSLHQFSKALATGEEAVKLNPYNSGIYGVLVDANVELGNYTKAVEMSDKMISLRPDLRSYSRISYLREIHGEVKGSIEAMDLAVSSGYPGFEQTAWCRLNLGHLHETYGNLDHAKMNYQIALDERPNYPFAIASLAGIEMKLKNYKDAETMLLNAIAVIPEVSFTEQLAELYALQGRTEEANKTMQEVLVMLKDDADHGHTVDLEYAKVYLHGMKDNDKALEYAMIEYKVRPENIDVNKVLAEIWYRKNDIQQAAIHLEKAMKTHSQDPALLGIAGLIRIKQGNAAEGKKLIKQSLQSDPFQNFAITPDLKNSL